jgi:hypothetical protein
MGGDYTRFTFDRVKGYSGVHKQQGRVSLDADFNEFEEILDRRSRAQMYDTVGRAVVPSSTPDAFKIGISGTSLTIGPGRAYVDGILVECFGDLAGARAFDSVLGGVHGGSVKYEDQPRHYEPDYPGRSTAASRIDLAYLDVWQREVTVLEDEALLRQGAAASARWRRALMHGFRRAGATPAEARRLAVFVVAAVEGALMLARAERNLQPLTDVGRELETRVRAALGRPHRPAPSR